MLFGLSAVLALFLGLLSWRDERKSALGFLWLLVFVPTGNSYADFISISGVYFFDFYLLGVLVALFLKSMAGVPCDVKVPKGVVAFLLLYFVYYFIFYFLNGFSKYFIKDLRPVIFLLLFVAFYSVCRSGKEVIKSNDIFWLVIVGSVLNFADLLWINLGIVAYKDEFYETNSYRYLDVATYFSVAYVIAYFGCDELFSAKRKLPFFAMLFAFFCIFLSNSRFVLLSVLAALLATQWGRTRRFIALSLVGIVSISSFLIMSYMIGAERIIAGMEEEGLILQIATRFGPGIELVETMNFLQLIIGLGPGTFFDIPWFEYRGLETENVNIDSAYMTFYVKYGLLSFVLLYGYLASFLNGAPAKLRLGAYVFFGLMFVVSASPYQPYAIGFGLAAILFGIQGRQKSGIG